MFNGFQSPSQVGLTRQCLPEVSMTLSKWDHDPLFWVMTNHFLRVRRRLQVWFFSISGRGLPKIRSLRHQQDTEAPKRPSRLVGSKLLDSPAGSWFLLAWARVPQKKTWQPNKDAQLFFFLEIPLGIDRDSCDWWVIPHGPGEIRTLRWRSLSRPGSLAPSGNCKARAGAAEFSLPAISLSSLMAPPKVGCPFGSLRNESEKGALKNDTPHISTSAICACS